MMLPKHLALVVALVLSLSLLQVISPLVRAQESDTTPPPATESADEETTQNLKKRIERVVQDKKTQIEAAVNQLQQRRVGFVGQVQRLSENSITIKNPKGTQILPITEAVALTKAGKTIELSNVEVDDWVAVVGTLENEQLTPESIKVSDSSLRPADHEVVLGSVTELSSSSLQLTARLNEESHTFSISKSTQFQDLSGQDIKVTEIEAQMQVLVIGVVDGTSKKASLVKALANIE